jgi:CDP-glucose 4,6-dehydratase
VIPAFWQGRRVFITGHTGFKGSWLILLLRRLGAEVKGFSLAPPTEPSLYAKAGLFNVVPHRDTDIRNFELLKQSLIAAQPEVIFHFAAQSVVLSAYEEPLETYSTNVMGTANILQAARSLTSHCALVNVTTDKVYENTGGSQAYLESDRLGGRDPYSSSKACAELVARAFQDSYFSDAHSQVVALASARAGNVIGGGDWTARQLIPESVHAFHGGRSVVLRHPAAVRPWQHVLDCLGGYMSLAEALTERPQRFAGAWNFGPAESDARTVAQVVEKLATLWEIETPWVQDQVQHAHEEAILNLNTDLTRRELGWEGRLSIDTALDWTAQWFKAFFAGQSAAILCDHQIERYLSKVV